MQFKEMTREEIVKLPLPDRGRAAIANGIYNGVLADHWPLNGDPPFTVRIVRGSLPDKATVERVDEDLVSIGQTFDTTVDRLGPRKRRLETIELYVVGGGTYTNPVSIGELVDAKLRLDVLRLAGRPEGEGWGRNGVVFMPMEFVAAAGAVHLHIGLQLLRPIFIEARRPTSGGDDSPVVLMVSKSVEEADDQSW